MREDGWGDACIPRGVHVDVSDSGSNSLFTIDSCPMLSESVKTQKNHPWPILALLESLYHSSNPTAAITRTKK